MQKTAMIIAALFFLAVAPVHVVLAMDNQETESPPKTVQEQAECKQDPEVTKAYSIIKYLKEQSLIEKGCSRPSLEAYHSLGNKILSGEPILSLSAITLLSSLSLTDTEGNVLEPARQAFDRLGCSAKLSGQELLSCMHDDDKVENK